MRIAYWRRESVRVLRQCAANWKKSPRNTNWKLKTLQYCCALPNGVRGIVVSIYWHSTGIPILNSSADFLTLFAAFFLFVGTLPIVFALLGRKRKCIKTKTTEKLTEKRTSIASVRDILWTFGTFPTPLLSRHRLPLKWTWRQKFIYMLTLPPKGTQTKLLKFFCLKIFSICHRWCTLSCEYLCKFLKKFGMAVIVYSDAWGETDSWKKPEVENLVTLSL